ncbi:GNAT family N-acetyltransferase [Halorubrum trapanicum]|uniref:GNAT family N-acetyltransferase n=1 Tax=Halorubrum trapanicum TaxID=29284 RepID=UPI000BBB3C78|nr:GNAT family N-acetyltransferase [Halorubrum trapanicum]
MTDEYDLPGPPGDVTVEPAVPDDRLDVLRILDAAMLETDADAVDDRIAAGDVLVARSTRTGGVVGALVAVRPASDRLHVDAVAVRRARRGRGIGSALVAAAVDRGKSDPAIEAVTARFDADLRAFYEALGFTIRSEEAAGDAADRGSDRLDGKLSVGGRESA